MKEYVPYSPEIAAKICELLAQGEFVQDVAKLDGMPTVQAIWSWSWKHPEFYEALDKAREFGAHAMNYKLMEKIQDVKMDKDEIARLKILVDQWRWFIGKINQRKYGDNMTIKGDADNPIQLTLATALDARIAAARAAPVIEHESSSAALPVIDAITDG